MNDDIENIPEECFNYIILPNPENSDVSNIYLFYRDIHKIEDFKKYLNELNLKDMIYKLFNIPDKQKQNAYDFLNNLQETIKDFNYSKLTKKEQQKLKWLLYDCKDNNGNSINNKKYKEEDEKGKEEYKGKNEDKEGKELTSNLYVYFIDKTLLKTLNSNPYKRGEFAFYKNSEDTKMYLKYNYTNKNNKEGFKKIHELALSEEVFFKHEKGNVIDHIQEAPLYFYDFNYLTNFNNILVSEQSKTKKIKNIIYAKIIESWKDRIIVKHEPQFNNCSYNLLELNRNINKTIKAKMIDKSKIIYPCKDVSNENILYINFYFPKPQKLKTTNGLENIVLLSIVYDLTKIDYTSIIKELKANIYNDNTTNNYDENINYTKLFEYIKGKEIWYMLEDKNDINQKAILETKDIFYNNKKLERVENYQ